MRTFTLGSTDNIYSDYYNDYNSSSGYTGPRATRNASRQNQNTLIKNIASTHASEFKEAFEYIEDGNISGFQSVIDKIQANEAAKQRTYNITDSEISSAIEDAYQQVVGADYDSSITSTKMSSRSSGFIEGITLGIPKLFGIGDNTSSAEYVAQRRGTEVNETEKAAKTEGKLEGIATFAGLAFAGTCIATKGAVLAGIGTFCASNPIGWVLGGLALTIGGAAFIANQVSKKA